MKLIKLIPNLFLIALFTLFMQACNQGGSRLSDAEITSNVQSKLAADKMVSTYNVKATSQSGIVVLVGDVNSDDEVARIVAISESTPGVSDTDASQLTVKKSKPSFDSILTAKVKGAFIREKLYGDNGVADGIMVDTKDSVVYLTGEANSQAQADNAVTIAKSVNGVKSVDSKITVKKVQ